MRVHCIPMPLPERRAFEGAIRDSGRDPGTFRVQVFAAQGVLGAACGMRCVHVASDRGAAQYDASEGSSWTDTFTRHLARGFFG